MYTQYSDFSRLSVNVTSRPQDTQHVAHNNATAGDKNNEEPFVFASPDGRSRMWTTIGQDKPGKNHPFLRRMFRHKSDEGFTYVDKTEMHWAVTPFKDGKTRGVQFQVTWETAVYDKNGRELPRLHKTRSFEGSFQNHGDLLPFEKPVVSGWPRIKSQPDDEQARSNNDGDEMRRDEELAQSNLWQQNKLIATIKEGR